MGYSRAGFEVVGVDIEPQPHYPFRFIQADALIPSTPGWIAGEFDAIHASPPCQAHTTMSNRHRGVGGIADDRLNLIPPTLDLLRAAGLPWIVENVPGAKKFMPGAVTLHGGMFGLGVQRPRLFIASFPLTAPPYAPKVVDPIGVYGKAADGRRLFTRSDGSIQRAAVSVDEARAAMGMPWGDWHGVKEAIPPAYCEFIGTQLMSHINAKSESLDLGER